jgi:hypothetical protein
MYIRIYALAVCFAAVLCLAVSLGIGLYDIVQLSFPHQTMDSYQHRALQSNEQFRQSHNLSGSLARAYPGALELRSGLAPALALSEGATRRDPPSEEEVTRHREQALRNALTTVRHDARNSLIQILIILLVSGSLLIVHWRLAKRLDANLLSTNSQE